jgi:hypothetical protein
MMSLYPAILVHGKVGELDSADTGDHIFNRPPMPLITDMKFGLHLSVESLFLLDSP